MIAIKVEYEGESINVALYEGIEVEEFTEVILSSLRINGTIIGLKDSNGVILLPKFICQNVANLQQMNYELIVKTKDGRAGMLSPQRKAEPPKPVPYPSIYDRAPPPEPVQVQSKPDSPSEADILQLLKYLRMDGFLNEAEERTVVDLFRSGNADLLSSYQAYQRYPRVGIRNRSSDFITLKTRLKQIASRRSAPSMMSAPPYTSYMPPPPQSQTQPQLAWQAPESANSSSGRPGTGYRTRRPVSAKWNAPTNMNSTQAMLIGAVHDLEERKLLDEQVVCTVKTLILEENHEVIKLLNSYIAHMLDERELCTILQKLSDRMSTYIERPSSPLPRKSSLLEFVNSIATTYMHDREDIALLQRLIEDENEFVLSAFDVFESDRDQENLLDTLLRIVAKCKRMGMSKDSVTATGFYDGNMLVQRPDTRSRPRMAESKPKRGGANEYPQSSESESNSNVPANEFQFRGDNKSEDQEEQEPEAVNLPAAGLVYVTRRSKKQPQSQPQTQPPAELEGGEDTNTSAPTFKDFDDTGALQDLRDEVVGTLRWALKNRERTLVGAYETYKLTTDTKLLQSTVSTICGKIFDTSLSENMSKDQVTKYRERKKRRNSHVLKAIEEFRRSGNLMELMSELNRLTALATPKAIKIADDRVRRPEPEPEPEEKPAGMIKLFEVKEAKANEEAKSQQTPEESNDEAMEKEIAGDILNMLEAEGRISKDDIPALIELYRQGNKDVTSAIDEFKRDHDLGNLGDKLSPMMKRKRKDDGSAKKKKKKKYKTFDECIEFFKV